MTETRLAALAGGGWFMVGMLRFLVCWPPWWPSTFIHDENGAGGGGMFLVAPAACWRWLRGSNTILQEVVLCEKAC